MTGHFYHVWNHTAMSSIIAHLVRVLQVFEIHFIESKVEHLSVSIILSFHYF